MEQRHEEEFTSTVCIIEGSGSKGTVSAFHANTGRKENLGKYYLSLPVKTLTRMILRCTVCEVEPRTDQDSWELQSHTEML